MSVSLLNFVFATICVKLGEMTFYIDDEFLSAGKKCAKFIQFWGNIGKIP